MKEPSNWNVAFWYIASALIAAVIILLCSGCADPMFLDVVTAPAVAVSAIHGRGDAYESYNPK